MGALAEAMEIRELAIVVVAKNHNPTILNPDFLKHNEIVPEEWELERPPICIEPMAEVNFGKKIKITSQLDKVIFLEEVAGKRAEDFTAPKIARKYTETLPHVEYTAVGINPKGHIVFDNNREAPRRFITDKLIAPGPWCNYGVKPVKPSINFEYFLPNAICNLTIEEKLFRGSDKAPVPVLLFASNFHHQLLEEGRDKRLAELTRILSDWESDLSLYKNLVEEIFLSEAERNEK